MNIIIADAIGQFFGDFTLLERLFWATIELTVLAVAVWVGIRIFRKLSPRVRALLWLLVLVKPLVALCVGAALPIFEVDVLQPPLTTVQQITMSPLPKITTVPETEPAATTSTASATSTNPGSDMTASTTATTPVQTIPATRPEAPARALKITWPGFPILFAYSWIAIALLLGLYKGLDVIRLRRLIRTSNVPPTALKERYEAIVNHIGVKHPPRLCITETLESPALAGVLRPVILLPQWMLDDKYEAAVAWALRHELIHWKHGDTLANLLRQITQVLFFFHPLAWISGKRWEEEAELACDRALINTTDEANEYAHSLYEVLDQLHGRRQHALATGLFATRTQVGRRITALLTNPLRHPAKLGVSMVCALILITMTVLAVGGTFNNDEFMYIGGIIVDEFDSPIEGVNIKIRYKNKKQLFQFRQTSHSLELSTNNTGHWQVHVPTDIESFAWESRHPDFPAKVYTPDIYMNEDLKKRTWRYVLRRGKQISGIVVDIDGTPVSGAIAAWESHKVYKISEFREGVKTGEILNATITDAEGRFTLAVDDIEGPVLGFVLMEGFAPATFFPSDSTNNHHITLEKGIPWSGMVRNSAGDPLKDVIIDNPEWRIPGLHGSIWRGYLLPADKIEDGTLGDYLFTTSTDASGRFTMNHLPATGKLDLLMRKKGFFNQRIALKPDSIVEPQEYCLYPDAPLQGRVVDGDTGAPVKRFAVKYEFSKAAESVPSLGVQDWQWFNDRKGEFAMDLRLDMGNKPGAISLNVKANNYHAATVDPVNVLDFYDTPLEIKIKPAEPITGTVVTADGKSVRNAEIAIETGKFPHHLNIHSQDKSNNSTITGFNGGFELEPFNGFGILRVSHESGWALKSLSDHKSDTPLVLTPWSSIEGKIPVEHFPPQAIINMKIVFPEEWGVEKEFWGKAAKLDTDGSFRIDQVPALPVRISIFQHVSHSHTVTITPEESRTMQVHLYPENSGSVQGVLLKDGLKGPEPGMKVGLWHPMRTFVRARPKYAEPEDRYVNFLPCIQENGSFTIGGLLPGEYDLLISHYAIPFLYETGGVVAEATREFRIPDDQDAPLDLGKITIPPVPHPQPGQEAPGIIATDFDTMSFQVRKCIDSHRDGNIEDEKIEGPVWRLSDEKGTLVLLVFWTTWSDTIKEQASLLDRLWQQHGKSGKIKIIGLNLDTDSEGGKFFATQNTSWPQYYVGRWNPRNSISHAYGIKELPSNWLIDANGVILEANIPSNALEAVIEKHCGS